MLTVKARDLSQDDLHTTVTFVGQSASETKEYTHIGYLVGVRIELHKARVLLYLSRGQAETVGVYADGSADVDVDRRPPKASAHFGS